MNDNKSGLDELFGGFSNINEPIKEETRKSSTKEEPKKKEKKLGRPTKERGNYKILVAIDNILEEYFTQDNLIPKKNDYINGLIRDDMCRRVGIKTNATDEELIQKWNEYKEQMKAFFK